MDDMVLVPQLDIQVRGVSTPLMAWYSPDDQPMKLYLKIAPDKPWQLYTESSQYVPDYLIKGGSLGYATYQVLLKKGWKLVPSEDVRLES